MDLIDREAARKAICERCENYSTVLQECKLSGGWCKVFSLYDVPAVNRWIPCSERLPENYEEVLVWFEYFRYGDYNCMYQTYGIGTYSQHYDSWLIDHETGWKNLNVIAWMPLPEPPKEGEHNGTESN